MLLLLLLLRLLLVMVFSAPATQSRHFATFCAFVIFLGPIYLPNQTGMCSSWNCGVLRWSEKKRNSMIDALLKCCLTDFFLAWNVVQHFLYTSHQHRQVTHIHWKCKHWNSIVKPHDSGQTHETNEIVCIDIIDVRCVYLFRMLWMNYDASKYQSNTFIVCLRFKSIDR